MLVVPQLKARAARICHVVRRREKLLRRPCAARPALVARRERARARFLEALS